MSGGGKVVAWIAVLAAQALCAAAALAADCPPGSVLATAGCPPGQQRPCCRHCARDKISNAEGTACIPCDHGLTPNRNQSACIGLLKPTTVSPKPVGAGVLDNASGNPAQGPAGAGSPLGGGGASGGMSGGTAGGARPGTAAIR